MKAKTAGKLSARIAGAAVCLAMWSAAAQIHAQVHPQAYPQIYPPIIDGPRDRVMVDPRRNSSGTNMSRDRIVPDERRWSAGTNMWREGALPDERRSTSANNVVRENEIDEALNARREQRPPERSWRAEQLGRARKPPELSPELAPERIAAIRKAEREKQQP